MKNLYKYFPVFIQNLAITILNNRKYYQKYGAVPIFNPLNKVISKLDVSSLNDINTVARINNLINEAVENVPYYQENKAQYKPISSLDELKNLPVLNKDVLKTQNEKFISKKSNRFNSYYFRTSGSTGTPLKGAISLKDLRKRLSFFLISLKHENIDYSRPVARFLGANITGGSGAVFRKDFINNHLLFSIYDLSQDKIYKYFDALKKNNIEIIEGYPSTIYSLVKFLKAEGFKLPSVKHVLTTAEKLLDYQKEEIEFFFQTNVFDYYGSSEGSAYMFLTKKGFYLNTNKVAYFETVDNTYNPVQGEAGKMLVTSFTSSFTPLIRYDIGDICSIINNDNEIIKVNEIIGRQDDVYITPNGTEFSRFSLVLKYLPKEVVESQLKLYQQTNKAEIIYVANKKLPIAKFKAFHNKLNSMLRIDFDLSFNYLPKFQKINRGKLSAVKIITDEN
tara:strand:+ start:115 stop:1461 length:1347 start_codon:yes stop_codon:yes gene_type:complete